MPAPPIKPPGSDAPMKWAAIATIVVAVLVLGTCASCFAWLFYGLFTGTLQWNN